MSHIGKDLMLVGGIMFLNSLEVGVITLLFLYMMVYAYLGLVPRSQNPHSM
jgi:hypothetical protein